MATQTREDIKGREPPGLIRSVFSFPSPVKDVAARFVAGMVVALSLAVLLTEQWWLMFVLAYGFLARVATGPTLSPMGLLATRVAGATFGKPKATGAGPAQTIRPIGGAGLLGRGPGPVLPGGLSGGRQECVGDPLAVRHA